MRRESVRNLIWMAAAVMLSCSAVQSAAQGDGSDATVELPSPQTRGELTFEEAVYRRRSVREYTSQELSLATVGQLLWSALGRTVDGLSGPTRAAPSAGGLYPVQGYAVVGAVSGTEPGVYRYDWQDHVLVRLRSGDVREELARAALRQAAVRTAPCIVVLGVDYEVTHRRYGARGVERYVHMDVGHAAQNLALQATALTLGAVTIGAFEDRRVRDLLSIPTQPLYLIPVGHPR